jgi:hypothetical protein
VTRTDEIRMGKKIFESKPQRRRNPQIEMAGRYRKLFTGAEGEHMD